MATTGEESNPLVKEADAFLDKEDYASAYAILVPHKDSHDAEVLWRLAWATLEKGGAFKGEDKKSSIYQSFEYSKEALNLDDNNGYCHLWYGITSNEVAEFEGTKQQIANAFTAKEHFDKALELIPTYPFAMHALGMWCFTMADMKWYERKIAGLLFSSPPTSTFEEAFKHFDDAEKAEPGFYNMNTVMRAATMVKLKMDKDKARDILLDAVKCKGTSSDDKESVEIAKELLKKEFGVKQ